MKRDEDADYKKLETMWTKRAERVAAVRERADPTGMTRPERDATERDWLDRRGNANPFTETPRSISEQET